MSFLSWAGGEGGVEGFRDEGGFGLLCLFEFRGWGVGGWRGGGPGTF